MQISDPSNPSLQNDQLRVTRLISLIQDPQSLEVDPSHQSFLSVDLAKELIGQCENPAEIEELIEAIQNRVRESLQTIQRIEIDAKMESWIKERSIQRIRHHNFRLITQLLPFLQEKRVLLERNNQD